jgi:hypothetical protein
MKPKDLYSSLGNTKTFKEEKSVSDLIQYAEPKMQVNLFNKLLDGSHVGPLENPRIMQDDHPNKSKTHTMALKRYEDSLKKQGTEYNSMMIQHSASV